MLQSLWYIEQPLDFEYKNYILLHYLQEIDHHYKKKRTKSLLTLDRKSCKRTPVIY